MKKLMVLAFLTAVTTTYSDIPLYTTEMTDIEPGLKGIEIEANYLTRQLSDKEQRGIELLEKYTLIETNNSFLNRELEKDNIDRENLFKVGYNRIEINKSDIDSFNLLFGTTIYDDERLGISFNYSKLKDKYQGVKLDGNFYQANFFYNQKDQDGSEVFTTLYLGASDEDNSDVSFKTKFIGFYGKYAKELNSDLNYFTPRLYFEGDMKRIQGKIDTGIEKKKENNDSINAGLGVEAVTEVFLADEVKVDVKAKTGYNHEFMEKRKYKTYDIKKDDFKDNMKAGIEVSVKYKEVLEVYGGYEVRKSLSASNYENVGTVGFKIMF